MQHRRLGQTDLSIAPLVFGGNVFGWTADKARSFDLLDRFVGAGLNAIDTADVYSAWAPGNKGGESEAILGEWMKTNGRRDELVIITKVGSDMGRGKKGLKAAYVEQAAEASLRRLQIDVIDLYLAHFPDDSTPHEETLSAFAKLKQAGKIRWFGCSNYTAGQLSASFDAARANGLPRYEVLQPEYNLYDRDKYEGALRDLCMEAGLGVITYFSLAKGFLSGKYRSDADTGKSARGGGVRGYFTARGFRILDALAAVAARHDAKSADVALAWLVQRTGVTAPIASATSPAQLESLVNGARLQLSPGDVAELDAAAA